MLDTSRMGDEIEKKFGGSKISNTEPIEVKLDAVQSKPIEKSE